MDQNRRDYADLDRPQRRPVDWQRWRQGLRSAVVPLLIVGVVAAFLAGYLAGALGESQRQYRARFERDRDVLAPVLAADPAFARVQLHPNSGGGVELVG